MIFEPDDQDFQGHSWTDKLAWVGMKWKIVSRVHRYTVKVSNAGGGLVSFGGGDTLEEALADAARGIGICWNSVSRKMTEKAWEEIAHC